jgi:universal stress protein family protein
MTNSGYYRRIVAWTDGSDKAAHAADWAARHAVARALPLHVLYIPRRPALAAVGPGHGFAGTGFAAEDEHGSDLVRVADDVRRLRARYRDLSVNEQVVRDGRRRPEPGLLDRGDILVTWPSGYLELVEQTELEEHAAARVPAPTVFVPDGVVSASSGQCVLLLTGPRFFPAAARFAFAAAADLGVALDVVRLPGVHDDDYATDPAHGPYAVGRHLRAEVAKLRGRFLGVPGDSYTLGVRPWSALRAMADGAELAVLGTGVGCGVDVRAVYDLDTCPVAIVPSR